MFLSLHYFLRKAVTRVRGMYYSRLFKRFGSDSRVLGRIGVVNPENIEIGFGTSLNEGCFLNARAPIIVGDHVHISQYVVLTTTGLELAPDVEGKRRHFDSPIYIEDGVWLGAHVVVVPGIRVGKGSVIGAGAVVTKDVAPHSKIAGVPGKSYGNVPNSGNP